MNENVVSLNVNTKVLARDSRRVCTLVMKDGARPQALAYPQPATEETRAAPTCMTGSSYDTFARVLMTRGSAMGRHTVSLVLRGKVRNKPGVGQSRVLVTVAGREPEAMRAVQPPVTATAAPTTANTCSCCAAAAAERRHLLVFA